MIHFIKKEQVKFETSYGIQTIPLVIAEINQGCNLVCPGCYMRQEDKRDPDVLMTPDDIGKIIEVTRPESIDILGGEPTLSPQIRGIIRKCNDNGVLPWIYSNLTIVDGELAKFLFDEKVYVTGKLNIGNPESPEQRQIQAEMIGGSLATVDKLFRGIETMRETGYRKPMFSMENLLRRKNIAFAGEYTRWCLERGIRADVELPSCAIPACANPKNAESYLLDVAPTVEQIKAFARELEQIYEEFGIKDPILPPHISGGVCRFKDRGIYFSKKDGRIYMQPCSSNTTDLGEFTGYDSLRNALENPVMRARRTLKELWTENKIKGKCGECDYFVSKGCLGGCRATAENLGAAKADIYAGSLESYPLCWVK